MARGIIRARFKLEAIERTALFQESRTNDFQQKGWGTTVTLSQVRQDAMTGKLKMVLNPVEVKVFNDAPIGAEFDIVVSLAMSE